MQIRGYDKFQSLQLARNTIRPQHMQHTDPDKMRSLKICWNALRPGTRIWQRGGF